MMLNIKWTISRGIFLIICLIILNGCATTVAHNPKKPIIIPKYPISKYVQKDVKYPVDAYDPFEKINRRMYVFNAKLDRHLFLPVVDKYQQITPAIIQTGVRNFFNNLEEITNLSNSLLQFKLKSFLTTAWRVVINSTAGIAGVFNIATPLGLERQDEDFGQTLGFYGVGPGPYLVLPIFGPSTLRDTGGLLFDTLVYHYVINKIYNEFNMQNTEKQITYATTTTIYAINERSINKFRYYETGSPFEYDVIRLLYLTKRRIQVGE